MKQKNFNINHMSAANFFYSRDLVSNWTKEKTPYAEIA